MGGAGIVLQPARRFSSEPKHGTARTSRLPAARSSLDPMDAEAHATLGEGLGYAGEAAEAEAALERAVA